MESLQESTHSMKVPHMWGNYVLHVPRPRARLHVYCNLATLGACELV